MRLEEMFEKVASDIAPLYVSRPVFGPERFNPIQSDWSDRITETSLTEAAAEIVEPRSLGDICTIKVGLQDADFWVIRRGSEAEVGRPVRTYGPEHIGIKVVRPDIMLPDYLFYLIQYLHSRKVFSQMARGTLRLVSIRTEDLRDIPIRSSGAVNEGVVPSVWEAVVNGDGHLSLLTHPGTRRWRKMKAKSEPGTPDWFKTWFSRPYLTNGPKGQQIKEGRDAPLYHGTSAMLAADIISQDAITAGYNEVRLANGDIVEGVSLTRDPRVALRFGPVVFELDQAKLVRDGHRMIPHDHWGTGSDELSGDDATDTAPLRTGIRYEAEELVVGSIEDLSRYLRAIHFDASVLGEPLGTAYGNACSIVTEHPLSHEVPQRWSRRRAPERYLKAIHIAEAPIRATLHTYPSYYGATVQAPDNIKEPIVLIPTNKITVFEPDSKFDDPKYAKNLDNIKAAINKGKQLPAILVRRVGAKYQVVDGHHRFKAYRELKIKQIPARIVLPQNITVIDSPEQSVREAWSKKYKNSINCDNPKGFSQRAHGAGRKIRSHRSRRRTASINEGRDAPLFHGTGFPNAVHILDNKEIEARTLQFAPNRDGIKGVSLSRSMDVSKRWGPVVFEFDQAKLAHRYRMNPIDYWGQGREPELAGEARRHGRFAELEEFIDGPIRDPERYLKAIHISIAGAKRAISFGLMADEIRTLLRHPLAKPMP
jgi:hypothetical protein